MWDTAEAPIENEDIKQAMFSIGGLKAPGIDGYPTIFFQRNWNQVGPAVCKAIKSMWTNAEEIRVVNKTLITLIPKVENPETASQFRPISLCNVLYK